MYQLIRGSIFDQKCDVVIIPCNNDGGIAFSVKWDLASYGLPTAVPISNPGQVVFQYPEKFAISSVVAYSASVECKKNGSSTKGNLHDICSQIIEYCRRNSLCSVNLPLLGTGAGRLPYEESFQIIKQHFAKEPHIKANIFALSKEVYELLKAMDPHPEAKEISNPRVFISYTGYDSRNKEWVRDLCFRLRENGVDARCDILHLKLGQDVPQWMTNEINLADKVLIVCDKYYLFKTNPRRGGVGWETMIIQGDMLMNQENNKYICIMREKDEEMSLPAYMRTKYSLQWEGEQLEDEKLKQLLFGIFDCENIPPVKPIPQYIKERITK